MPKWRDGKGVTDTAARLQHGVPAPNAPQLHLLLSIPIAPRRQPPTGVWPPLSLLSRQQPERMSHSAHPGNVSPWLVVLPERCIAPGIKPAPLTPALQPSTSRLCPHLQLPTAPSPLPTALQPLRPFLVPRTAQHVPTSGLPWSASLCVECLFSQASLHVFTASTRFIADMLGWSYRTLGPPGCGSMYFAQHGAPDPSSVCGT